MKIIFRKDTGKIYGISPSFELDHPRPEMLSYILYEFAANVWESSEVDLELGENGAEEELTLWFSKKPKNPQQYVDDLATHARITIPQYTTWKS